MILDHDNVVIRSERGPERVLRPMLQEAPSVEVEWISVSCPILETVQDVRRNRARLKW